MAHIESSSSKKRGTNVELNLVPFIDLMSVLITFLLISAVWTQVSMIQLGASFLAPKKNDSVSLPQVQDEMIVKINVVESGFILFSGNNKKEILKNSDGYDTLALLQELEEIKKNHPSLTTLKIAMSDAVAYEHLVSTMDTGLKVGLSPELLTGAP